MQPEHYVQLNRQQQQTVPAGLQQRGMQQHATVSNKSVLYHLHAQLTLAPSLNTVLIVGPALLCQPYLLPAGST
jgi:hypothetical protein